MAGRYLPPHMRPDSAAPGTGTGTSTEDKPTNNTASTLSSDTQGPYRSARRDEQGRKIPYIEKDTYTQKEIFCHFHPLGDNGVDASANSSTLHASPNDPDTLGYVLLFAGANPKWESNRLIFAKSNLNLLPEPGPGHVAAPHPAFAVFESSRRSRISRFKFIGWHRIDRLEVLAPRSQALVSMLQQKWELRDRNGNVKAKQRAPKGWEQSLNHTWAVIKMELDEEANKTKGVPQIERLESEQEPAQDKSVNELLHELRFGKAADAPQEAQNEGGIML